MEKTIHILMLGGDGCGKRTFLASMFHQFNFRSASTGATLECQDDGTRGQLEKAANGIREKMDRFREELVRVCDDPDADRKPMEYSFRLTMRHHAPRQLIVHDIPAERLGGSQSDGLKEIADQCSAIIICVDTPRLMGGMTPEGYGLHHNGYNRTKEITEFFKKSLSTEQIRDRLILFVPVKCERYYHMDRIRRRIASEREYGMEIVTAIGNGYRDLIRFLRFTPDLANGTTIAISPALSAGGIEFVRFEQGRDGRELRAMYQRPEFLPESEQGYHPKFCDYPLLLTLIHVLRREIDEKSASQSGRWRIGGDSVARLKETCDTLSGVLRERLDSGENTGHMFLQNPGNI